MRAPVLLLGHDCGPTRTLQASLDADDLLAFPDLASGDGSWAWSWRQELERWDAAASAGGQRSQVVVCCWEDEVGLPRAFVDLDAAGWLAEIERRMALWFVAVRAATRRCADGGAMVVVVERPAPLDASGRAALVAAAEGVISVTRTVAAAHGGRGVRANAVTTELWTAPAQLLGAAPPLSTFPGRIDHEVAGTVRFLLSDDAAGVTASVSTPDGGRTV